MSKYWKTTVTTIVLTEGDEHPDYDQWGGGLEGVSIDIDDGEASGSTTYEYQEVTEAEMAELLIAQGSDPAFLIQNGLDVD